MTWISLPEWLIHNKTAFVAVWASFFMFLAFAIYEIRKNFLTHEHTLVIDDFGKISVDANSQFLIIHPDSRITPWCIWLVLEGLKVNSLQRFLVCKCSMCEAHYRALSRAIVYQRSYVKT
jgi:hypothetical protein